MGLPLLRIILDYATRLLAVISPRGYHDHRPGQQQGDQDTHHGVDEPVPPARAGQEVHDSSLALIAVRVLPS